MELWRAWFACVAQLRGACSRNRTFIWMVLVLAAFSVRADLAGVTSFVRALALKPSAYPRLLHFFHCDAVNARRLTRLWSQLANRIFPVLKVNGRRIFLVDGIKKSKEGHKMPAVKKLHQSSQNNSKPAYIMGHSLQAISLLVQSALGVVAAVPLTAEIHEGVVFTEDRKQTLPTKMAGLGVEIARYLDEPAIFVGDAYYACKQMINPLLEQGHDLVTRVRSNAVAYFKAPSPKVRRRGRPKLYGKKVKLKKLFENVSEFIAAPSPVYGETMVEISYLNLDLLWRPLGRLVRFVLVIHPRRGRIILMTTDLTMDPLAVIALYGYRFKIELGFKQAVHVIGTYAYHFWMKGMKPIKGNSGDQNLEKESLEYWREVIRKLTAYERYIQLGCIAQGLLQYLAMTRGAVVWNHFKSWLKTMNLNQPPSELVVAHALRASLNDFLATTTLEKEFKNILKEYADPGQRPELKKAA
ncbi:MAG: transposase [Planctomycetes bacterium]|nr:transposase [Planctomycetota bacterium]